MVASSYATDRLAVGEHVIVLVRPLAVGAGGGGAFEDEGGRSGRGLRVTQEPRRLRGQTGFRDPKEPGGWSGLPTLSRISVRCPKHILDGRKEEAPADGGDGRGIVGGRLNGQTSL